MPNNLLKNTLKKFNSLLHEYTDKHTVRNVLYMSAAIILFMFGVIIYGVILNTREVPLSEAMLEKGFNKLKHPSIRIHRENYVLELYEDSTLVKSYRVSFGRNVHRTKSKVGDEATPVGTYVICSVDTASQYKIFFRLNYPNISDASDALRKEWITQKQFDQIKTEINNGKCPTFNTILGGNIGIHGIGRLNFIIKNLPFVYNWTNGSIAMSDEDIDELYSVIKVGCKVVID